MLFFQANTILGFNEPNHPSQDNMSPEETALEWVAIQVSASFDPTPGTDTTQEKNYIHFTLRNDSQTRHLSPPPLHHVVETVMVETPSEWRVNVEIHAVVFFGFS